MVGSLGVASEEVDYSTSYGTCLVSFQQSESLYKEQALDHSSASCQMSIASHMGFCHDGLHLDAMQLKRPSPEAEPMCHLILNFPSPKLNPASDLCFVNGKWMNTIVVLTSQGSWTG